MCLCTYIHIYVYFYMCMCTCIHIYAFCTHGVCKYAYMYMCMCIYLLKNIYIYVYMSTYTYKKNIYTLIEKKIYICVHIHIYVYIYTYLHTPWVQKAETDTAPRSRRALPVSISVPPRIFSQRSPRYSTMELPVYNYCTFANIIYRQLLHNCLYHIYLKTFFDILFNPGRCLFAKACTDNDCTFAYSYVSCVIAYI